MLKEDKSGFVWLWSRIGFYCMLSLWVIADVLVFLKGSNTITAILSILTLVFTIFTFVLSIIHLNKYQRKAFAITALVISSILLVIFSLGFLIGFIQGAAGNLQAQ